jgi:hypothetical protein
MTNQHEPDGLAEYETLLGSKGVSLESLGLEEVALQRADALLAISALRRAGVAILGGDV